MTNDRYVIGRDFPRIAEIELKGSRDGHFLLAEVRNGDGGEIAFHLRDKAGKWTQVAGFTDGLKQVNIGEDGRLWAMSIKDAPLGRIVSIPLAQPTLARATVVVPETNIVAEHVTPTRSRLYVQYRDGGPSAVRMFSLGGKPMGELPVENNSEIAIGEVLNGDDVMVRIMSYLTPRTQYVYEAKNKRLQPSKLNGKPQFNFSDAAVERVFATSKDGTKIPISILHRKGMQLDGSTPIILYGTAVMESAWRRIFPR